MSASPTLNIGTSDFGATPMFIRVRADHLHLDQLCVRRLSRSDPAVTGECGGIDTFHDHVQPELELLPCDCVRDRIPDWTDRVRELGPGNDRLLDAVDPKVRSGRSPR